MKCFWLHSSTGSEVISKYDGIYKSKYLDTGITETYTSVLMTAANFHPKTSMLRRLKRSVRDALNVNRHYYRAAGGEQRPAFYDIDATYPSLRQLDQNYAVILSEIEALLQHHEQLPRYHDLARSERYISGTVNPDKNWKVFMLRSVAGTPEANQKKCPSTTELLARIPNVYQAFFSILDPGKSIPAHCGGYLGYLRYHLGLIVPKNNPPSMRVKDQIHIWKEGHSIVFDDSWEHEVYNRSDGVRVVLIVDFLRPMPAHLHLANVLISHVLSRHSEEAKQVMANIKKYS